MNCPACNTAMQEKDFGGVKVDICADGCKGIWFDWTELIKLDETHEGCGSALKEALNSPRVQDDDRGRIKCPHCAIEMSRHLYQASKNVSVDECYACGGFFLDSGELKAIRDSFLNDAQREAFFKGILARHPDLAGIELENERQQRRIAAAGKMSDLFKAINSI